MRQLLPSPVDDLQIDALAELFAYPAQGGVRANMVSSLDGAVAVNGRSAPISGPPDTFMFGFLRALADIVVVGAGTVRTEGYGPGKARETFTHLRQEAGQLDAPVIAVVTRSANLDPTSDLFTAARHRSLVITCSSAPADRRAALGEVADVLVTGDDTVDLKSAFAQLTERHLHRILCEGGPHLLADITAAGLLDELALAVSPLIAGGDASRIMTGQQPILQGMNIRALMEDEDFLFGLYSRAAESEHSERSQK